MSLPILAKSRGGAFAAAPAAPAVASGYDLDDSHNIDTTPFIHWDASTLVSVDGVADTNPNSTFSTWTSREGSDYELVQTDATEQFSYESSSSNMNSKPVAYASDNARHMMTATDFLSAGTVTMPVTITVALYMSTVSDGSNCLIGGMDASGNNINHFKDLSPRSSNWNIYMNDGGHFRGTAVSLGAQIITWELNPSGTSYFYQELARATVSGTVSSYNPFNYLLSLGASNTGTLDVSTNTEIAEVVIYNEVISDTTMSGSNVDGGELYTLITYLKSKYGIS